MRLRNPDGARLIPRVPSAFDHAPSPRPHAPLFILAITPLITARGCARWSSHVGFVLVRFWFVRPWFVHDTFVRL
jgi:hypothetical protein